MVGSSRLFLFLYCHSLVFGGKFPDSLIVRIVHGSPVKEGELPFQAVLYARDKVHCGGSIVARQWILTAAHCIEDEESNKDLIVGIGSIRVFSEDELLYKVIYSVYHEKFNGEVADGYDIGLVQTTPITTSSKIQVIRMIGRHARPSAPAIVSGFGQHHPGVFNPPSEFLMKAALEIVDPNEHKCREMATPDQICAIDTVNRSDSCQGDSGGPLTVGKYLVGIVSWGNGCSKPGMPGLYTDVAFHDKWILKQMSINSGIYHP